MTTGHPDYQTQSGRSVGGANITSFNFSGSITSENSSAFTLASVPSGESHIVVILTASVPDDTAIHKVVVTRVADSAIIFQSRFVTSLLAEINNFEIRESHQIKVEFINNSSSTLLFTGNLNVVVKEV